MVKNKSSSGSKSLKIMAWTFRAVETAVFLFVIGSGIYLWQNPQTVSSRLGISQTRQPQTDITAFIKDIDKKIENLDLIVRHNNEKNELVSRQFGYFDKSKADASQIIVLNNKLDTIQNKFEKLAKTSNSGALILTSAMLIRDNVSRGIGCQKEAEALKILAAGIDGLNQDIIFIADHCSQNFMSAASVADKFNNIYTDIKAAAEPKTKPDWKQRFVSKINEYVKVSKPEDKNNEKQFDALAALGKIKKLIDNGDLTAAAEELENPENAAVLENYADIRQWHENNNSQLKFYKALSNVISNALLIMKVEDARHESE